MPFGNALSVTPVAVERASKGPHRAFSSARFPGYAHAH